jgi:DNA-binding XRE family transcriptional regulator
MPKMPSAHLQLPQSTRAALEKLGNDLAVARLRRRESLATWASRIGVSIPTLMNMEKGAPTVSIGLYATALWLIGRDGELARLAEPEGDRGAFETDVRRALDLRNSRAHRMRRKQGKGAEK